jgi:hypothetical protein
VAPVRLTAAQAVSLAAVKALDRPTEVFRFTEHNGDQHEIECSHEGMAIALCDSHPDLAYVTDLDGNLIGGEFPTETEED